MSAIYKSECLDLVEIAHMDHIYPLIFCHLDVTGEFDAMCLRCAVALSYDYVPEILYGYDIRRCAFVDMGYKVERVFQANNSEHVLVDQYPSPF